MRKSFISSLRGRNKQTVITTLKQKIVFALFLFLVNCNYVNAQLKVHTGGTVTVGTGTGSTTSTLNLYSTNNSTIYSRATFTAPSSVAIK